MAVDDLTITSQRSQVVDFSVPYQTSTLQILIKVREKQDWKLILMLTASLSFSMTKLKKWQKKKMTKIDENDMNDNKTENEFQCWPRVKVSNDKNDRNDRNWQKWQKWSKW